MKGNRSTLRRKNMKIILADSILGYCIYEDMPRRYGFDLKTRWFEYRLRRIMTVDFCAMLLTYLLLGDVWCCQCGCDFIRSLATHRDMRA